MKQTYKEQLKNYLDNGGVEELRLSRIDKRSYKKPIVLDISTLTVNGNSVRKINNYNYTGLYGHEYDNQ